MSTITIEFEVTDTRYYTWEGEVDDLPAYVRRQMDDDPDSWEGTISNYLDLEEIRHLIDDHPRCLTENSEESDYDVSDITIVTPENDENEDDGLAGQDDDDQEGTDSNGLPIIRGECPYVFCPATDCDCECSGCKDARRKAQYVQNAQEVTVPPESPSRVLSAARPF